MNSRDYWLKREEEALKHRITDEREYQKEIDRIYQNMLDACQKEVESFYAKYAAAEGITIAEAKKRVAKHDVKAFERKAAKYVKEKDFSDKANEELRLYNATMRINRMEMLKANIGLETIAGHDELERFMGGILKGRTEDELARQAGILGKTVKNNAQKANAIVNGSFRVSKVGDQSTFSDRIWQYQDNMRQDLGKLLQQGLIQGKNPRAITKDLKKYWYGNDPKTGGGAKYCMERLMRTELARVQTEAQKQSFERNGFEHYEFIANRDCCPICNGLDGKHFRVDKMMPGENAPPMHPHCRCSTAAWVDDEEYEAWLDYLDKGGSTEEWNNLKMAQDAASSNDWDKTTPRNITKEEKRALIKYAAEKGINIPELNKFDGDPELLKSEIDALSSVSKMLPIGKKLTVTVSHSLPDDEFASTVGEHITFNAKVFRNRKITERNISLGGQFASIKVEDIAVHEYGHIFTTLNGNKGLEISGKAYYNVFGEIVDDDEMIVYLATNISPYSISQKTKKGKTGQFNRKKYKEIIPEILAKNNSDPDKFTREFVELLKEMNKP